MDTLTRIFSYSLGDTVLLMLCGGCIWHVIAALRLPALLKRHRGAKRLVGAITGMIKGIVGVAASIKARYYVSATIIAASAVATLKAIPYMEQVRGYKGVGGEYLISIFGIIAALVLCQALREIDEAKAKRQKFASYRRAFKLNEDRTEWVLVSDNGNMPSSYGDVVNE